VRHGALPYRAICERAAALERPPRHLELRTIGRAPVETPARPARLCLLRQPAPAAGTPVPPPTPARANAAGQSTAVEPEVQQGGEGEGEHGGDGSPRSRSEDAGGGLDGGAFAGQCRAVVGDQDLVEAYDAHKIYQSSSLFGKCSPCFIRHLVAQGGPSVWSGITTDVGVVVYSAGDTGHSAYIIVRGFAETISAAASAAAAAAAAHGGTSAGAAAVEEARRLGPGDCFGDAQAVGVEVTRQETVRAKTSMHLLEVSCSTLTRLLMQKIGPDADIDATAPTSWSKGRTLGSMSSPPEAPKVAERASLNMHDESDDHQQHQQYAFKEERRYFEREATRMYAALHPKSAGGSALNTTRTTRTAASYGSEEVPRSSTRSGASLWHRIAAAPDPLAAPSTPTGNGSPTVATATSPTAAAAAAASQGSSGGPAAPTPPSPRATPSSPAAGKHYSSLEDPRAWRKQLERAQLNMLEGGNSPEDHVKREKILNTLREEVRKDIKRGLMVPSDAADLIRRSPLSGFSRVGPTAAAASGAAAAEAARPARAKSTTAPRFTTIFDHGIKKIVTAPKGEISNPERIVQALNTLKGGRKEEEAGEEEEDTQGPSGAISLADRQQPLDLEMLPPLQYAGPRQKVLLIKDLERQARQAQARRKLAMRRRVASIIDSNRVRVNTVSISSAAGAAPMSRAHSPSAEGDGAVKLASRLAGIFGIKNPRAKAPAAKACPEKRERSDSKVSWAGASQT